MTEAQFRRKLQRMRIQGERQKAKREVEAEYEQYYPRREGAKVSNVMLAIIIAIVIIYTVASFILQFCTSVEISPTLTTCIFSFISIELLSLAGIRVSKINKEHKDKGDVE